MAGVSPGTTGSSESSSRTSWPRITPTSLHQPPLSPGRGHQAPAVRELFFLPQSQPVAEGREQNGGKGQQPGWTETGPCSTSAACADPGQELRFLPAPRTPGTPSSAPTSLRARLHSAQDSACLASSGTRLPATHHAPVQREPGGSWAGGQGLAARAPRARDVELEHGGEAMPVPREGIPLPPKATPYEIHDIKK